MPLVATSALLAVLWLVQRRTGNAGIVDAGWAASIGRLGIFFATTSGGYLPRRILVATLIRDLGGAVGDLLVAGPRPGLSGRRPLPGSAGKVGRDGQRRRFRFFQIQALAALFFALLVLVIAHHPVTRWTPWDLAGVSIWCMSVVNTILADRQRARFKRRPDSHGKTCREGWWRYSHHPLYLQGNPVGYFELDGESGGDIELAYFGVLPQFTGQGFGGYLLTVAINRAWERQPNRVWVHTSSFDHPQALGRGHQRHRALGNRFVERGERNMHARLQHEIAIVSSSASASARHAKWMPGTRPGSHTSHSGSIRHW